MNRDNLKDDNSEKEKSGKDNYEKEKLKKDNAEKEISAKNKKRIYFSGKGHFRTEKQITRANFQKKRHI